MTREVLKMALEAQERMKLSRDYARLPGYPLSDADRQMEKSTAALREALAQPVQPDNTSKLYEELRAIIDSGSESFTHADAVQYLKDNLASEKWTPEEDTAYRPGGLAQLDHPEQMARLGWQYFECPACGSEGARAFPKPEQPTIEQSLIVEQEPAFYGFMLEEECCVNICYSPCGPGGPNNELPTAYYTSPPKRQPEQDILDYVKGIYDFLESTSPTGFAQEAFRLPPNPTRNQRSLLDAAQGHALGQLSPPPRSNRGVESPSADLVELPKHQPLTDEEINTLLGSPWMADHAKDSYREFARAIEAAHGIGDKT